MSADPKNVEILRSGPTAWNAWRENNSSTVPDLTGIALTLSERQMGPINGGPINLRSARLQRAMLRFATLSGADLEAANMSAADFVHARFDRANLSAANLNNAQLDHADLSGATLTKANLCGASLQHAILSTADLEAADMSEADLMHARFDQANLSAANLTDACLDHADFAGANLTKANLCGASLQHARNLTESQLKESRGSDLTILPPHLEGSVPWSVARSPTERHDLGPRARLPAEVDVSPLGNRLPASIGRPSSPHTAFTASDPGHQVASWAHFSLASSGWWMRAMEGLLKREEGARFIGTIERLAEGWRASFRLLLPSQVFAQRGNSEVFDTELQATKWVHTQAKSRGLSSIEIRSRINPSSIDGVSSRRVAALFIGVTLVISAFVWQRMNGAEPLDTSFAQRASEPFLTQPNRNPETGTQGLEPSVPEPRMEEKAAERQPSADAEVLPTAASTVDQTETTPEQLPTPETERATVPHETDAKADLQASFDAKPSAEAFGSREHALETPEQGDDSALVSAESPRGPSQHAIVPDLPAAAPIRDQQVPPATEQPAEALAVNTPEPSAPMINAPDLPAVAVDTSEQPDSRAADQPAEARSVNTPEQHLDASPPNYAALPPVTTPPPSLKVTALPTDAETVPKPVRKPGIYNPAGGPAIQQPALAPPSVKVTALPDDAEIVPKPLRKPVIQTPAGKPVIQKPVTKPFIQKPVENPGGKHVIQKSVAKPVIRKPNDKLVTRPVKQRTEVDPKPAPPHRAKGQSFFDEKVRSSIADLLAGGL